MQDINQRPLCHRAEDLVTYLYGEANEADAMDFRNHLRQCDACRSEFAIFNQVHESIGLWRNEALGASFNPAAPVSESTIHSTQFVRHERRLSALAALREFFSVSPLWLRGATAFAMLLLCVLGIVMIARLSQKPVAIVNKSGDDKMYTRQQVDAEVKKALDEKAAELAVNKQNSAPRVANDRTTGGANQVQVAADRQPKNLRPRRLSREEREQLAADLRLTLPADEEELLLFP